MNQNSTYYKRQWPICSSVNDVLEVAQKLKDKTKKYVDVKPLPSNPDLLQDVLPLSRKVTLSDNNEMPREVLCTLGDAYDDNCSLAHRLLIMLNHRPTLDSTPELGTVPPNSKSLNRCAVRDMVNLYVFCHTRKFTWVSSDSTCFKDL